MCVTGSYELYTKLRLLHCNISSENLMFDPEERCGILNDFGMAKFLHQEPYIKHRTRALPFVALDLLEDWRDTHRFRHDLESYLCVVMFVALRYEYGEEKYKGTLKEWLYKSPNLVATMKGFLFDHEKLMNALPWNRSTTYRTIHESWVYPIWNELYRHYLTRRLKEKENPDLPMETEEGNEALHARIVNIFNDKMG